MSSPQLPSIAAPSANGLQIVYLRAAELKPYPNSPRVHNAKTHRKLQTLVRRFGAVVPVIVDEAHQIIDGHAYVEAAKQQGYDELPTVTVRNKTPAEIKALRLALNRVPQDAGWDGAKLRQEFEELIALSFDMELTGFDAIEIDASLEIDLPSAGAVEEEAAEDLEPKDAPVIVRTGDSWRLGDHVIVCGDATVSGPLLAAIGDRRAAAVFTDPPYNVKIVGNVSGLGATRHGDFVMASGEMSRDAFTDFLSRSIAETLPCLADGAILFICMDWRHARELADAADAVGLEQKNLIVWVKSNAGMGSFYRSQHELVFVYKKPGAPHQNNFELGQGGRSRSNVWRYAGVNTFGAGRKEQLQAHPTCKPVLLVADALRDVTRRGDLVLDPFLGSGTTLLAAEETGRVCVGVEIDPRYVEVAIRRWQKRTKRDAVNAATGLTFEAAYASRDVDPAAKEDDAGAANAADGGVICLPAPDRESGHE